MNIKTEVHYRDDDGFKVDDDEIKSIVLIWQYKNAILFSIETQTKYPTTLTYTGSGLWFKTKRGNLANVKFIGLPDWDAKVINSEPGRYNLFVSIFKEIDESGIVLYER